MNMRKITSLTALLSFTLLMVTAIILYIVPSGRVAYWSNWQLWSLSKEDWGAVHMNLGFLLLLSIMLHIYYNWKPMISYMKDRAKKLKVFTGNFNTALVITLVVFFGTLNGIPPMSAIIDLGDSITEDANLFYGEPPYGHAELSPLSDFSDKVKLDLNASIMKLKAAGIKFDSPEQTIKEISIINGVSPQEIYNLIKPEKTQLSEGAKMPEEPLGGTGKRKLARICEMYKLDLSVIIEGLSAKGIKASGKQTMKEISAANSLDPHAVYAQIYALTQ